MVKTILVEMKKYIDEEDKQQNEKPSLSSLAIDVEERPQVVEAQTPDFIDRTNVLLDGGASHNVYYSPKIPDGALKREVELAHGTKIGYVKGGDITFLDESVSDEQAEKPSIISLGRLIQKGIKLEWTKDGASLVLPSKRKVAIPVCNNCPYANQEVLKIVKKLRDIEEKNRQVRIYYANLFSALKLKIKSQQQLDEHRRQGHPQLSPDCPECKRGAAKQRSHQRASTRQGG